MKKYEVEIKGINVPIIWNVMKKELQDELKKYIKKTLPQYN